MAIFPIAFPQDKPNAGSVAAEAGFPLRQHNGEWIVETDDPGVANACQAWLDSFDAVAYAKAGTIARIKSEAGRRILLVADENKQRNATARRVELLGTPLVRGRPLSPEEETEAEAIDGLWNHIKAIRTASNRIEASLAEISDVTTISEFDPTPDELWT